MAGNEHGNVNLTATIDLPALPAAEFYQFTWSFEGREIRAATPVDANGSAILQLISLNNSNTGDYFLNVTTLSGQLSSVLRFSLAVIGENLKIIHFPLQYFSLVFG